MRITHGGLIDNVLNTSEQVSAQLGSMGDVFRAVAVGIVSVTVLVVILTLYMVIKTAILRQRRELGIQKAVGFTTLQLMNQIALNMTPVILIGVILGAVGGYFGFNPMMIALMTGMGVVQVDLPIPMTQMVAVCIALIVLAYVVSMLIAVRIRKISAYALVSE
jgi:putative ABC transport system permease protein